MHAVGEHLLLPALHTGDPAIDVVALAPHVLLDLGMRQDVEALHAYNACTTTSTASSAVRCPSAPATSAPRACMVAASGLLATMLVCTAWGHSTETLMPWWPWVIAIHSASATAACLVTAVMHRPELGEQAGGRRGVEEVAVAPVGHVGHDGPCCRIHVGEDVDLPHAVHVLRPAPRVPPRVT